MIFEWNLKEAREQGTVTGIPYKESFHGKGTAIAKAWSGSVAGVAGMEWSRRVENKEVRECKWEGGLKKTLASPLSSMGWH